MLLKDLKLLNKTLLKIVRILRQEKRRLLKEQKFRAEININVDACIYDYVNNILVKPEKQYSSQIDYFIAFNPYTKEIIKIDQKHEQIFKGRIIGTRIVIDTIKELLTHNFSRFINPQKNIYINAELLDYFLCRIFMRVKNAGQELTDESYFTNIYSAFKLMESNMIKNLLFFYYPDVNHQANRLTNNLKFVPLLMIKFRVKQDYIDKISNDILVNIINIIKSTEFEVLQPIVYNEIKHEIINYETYNDFCINVLFDNNIVMDLVGIQVVHETIITCL